MYCKSNSKDKTFAKVLFTDMSKSKLQRPKQKYNIAKNIHIFKKNNFFWCSIDRCIYFLQVD